MPRPTKYDPRYCRMLVEHMRTGLSWESFAGVVGVESDTLRNWQDRFPEFFGARKKGEALNRLFWEKVGIDGAIGKIKGFNPASWIFIMKNCFGWRDRGNLEINMPEPTVIMRRNGDVIELGAKIGSR